MCQKSVESKGKGILEFKIETCVALESTLYRALLFQICLLLETQILIKVFLEMCRYSIRGFAVNMEGTIYKTASKFKNIWSSSTTISHENLIFFQTATLSWDPVDCATSYEVVVRGVGGDSSSSPPPIYRQVEEGQTQVRLDELEPCSSYEVAIAAYLGDEAGEYTGRFATRSVKEFVFLNSYFSFL